MDYTPWTGQQENLNDIYTMQPIRKKLSRPALKNFFHTWVDDILRLSKKMLPGQFGLELLKGA
jgi:hypothetical protein